MNKESDLLKRMAAALELGDRLARNIGSPADKEGHEIVKLRRALFLDAKKAVIEEYRAWCMQNGINN